MSKRTFVGLDNFGFILGDLGTAAAVMLLPFVWLIAAAFKDAKVINEYVLFPPPSQLVGEKVLVDGDVVSASSLDPDALNLAREDDQTFGTLNFDNFDELFSEK
ncbi:MAG: hypothetical protein AAF561_14145, partial [Planctomycetota bacterium]